MPKGVNDWLIVLCVTVILAGLALDLRDRSHYGFPLLLGGGAALAGAVLWRSRVMRRAPTIGFLIGAAVPVAAGLYGMVRSIAYHNSNPDAYVCGTSACGMFALIFVVAPASGASGAAVVAVSVAIGRAIRKLASPAPPVQ